MSEYTDKCKEGIARVMELTADYEQALRVHDHGMAAIIRGQLGAARAYLQGLSDAGEILFDIDSDIHDNDTFFKDHEYE